MPFNPVNVAGNRQASGTTVVATMPNAVVAGDLLVAFALTHGAGSIADSAGNTWTPLTDNANIPSSTKHYRWFYCLSAASAAAGMTITVTGATSGTQYVQAAEFAWPGGVTGTLNATDASNVPITSATSHPITVTGPTAQDLLLFGIGFDAESTNSVTTSLPLLLDASGNSAGEAVTAMSCGIATKRSALAASTTETFTVGTANDSGMQSIGFSVGVADPLSFDHVFFIALENADRATIMGSGSAPNINGYLANSYGAQSSHYHATFHPSLPNYFQLITGSDQGESAGDDASPTITVANLLDNMTKVGASWRAYAENLPTPFSNWNVYTLGSPYDVGNYSSRHLPHVFMNSVMSSSTERAKIVDYTSFSGDLSSPMPQFVYLCPNRVNDFHSGTISQMDTWVGTAVSAIMASSAWTAERSLIVLWFDEDGEDAQSDDQLVPLLMLAKNVKSTGYTSTTAYNHLNMLATLQAIVGTRPSADLSSGAAVMTDFFQTGSAAPPVVPNLVQSGRALNNGSTGATVTLSTATKPGNVLVARAVWDPASGTVTPPVGFTQAQGSPSLNAGHSTVSVWYKVTPGGETSLAFTETGASQFAVYTVHEVSGLTNPGVDGVMVKLVSTSTNSVSMTYGSTPGVNEFAFACYVSSSATADSGATGWTEIFTPSSSWDSDADYWRITDGITAPSLATTLTGNASGAVNAIMVVLQSVPALALPAPAPPGFASPAAFQHKPVLHAAAPSTTTTVSDTPTLTAVANLTAAGLDTAVAAASLTVGASLGAAPIITRPAAAGLAATASLAATPLDTAVAAAALTTVATLAATPLVTDVSAAALTVAGALTAVGVNTDVAAAPLAAAATLTAAVLDTELAAAAIAATASVGVSGTITRVGAATLTAAAALTVSALDTAVSAAALNSKANLTAAPLVTDVAAAALTATAALAATAGGTITGTAQLTAAAALGVATQIVEVAAAALAAQAALGVSGVRQLNSAANLATIATLTAAGLRLLTAAADLETIATLAATAHGTAFAAAALNITALIGAAAAVIPHLTTPDGTFTIGPPAVRWAAGVSVTRWEADAPTTLWRASSPE